MRRSIHSTRRTVLIAFCLLGFAGISTAADKSQDDSAPKVVCHLDDSSGAMAAIRSIVNHLKAVPKVKIIVVALSGGVDFLLKDAEDDRGNPFEPMIDDLVSAGVEFRVCNNTLVARQIDRGRLHQDAVVVDSGVAEITRLQFFEGLTYLKL